MSVYRSNDENIPNHAEAYYETAASQEEAYLEEVEEELRAILILGDPTPSRGEAERLTSDANNDPCVVESLQEQRTYAAEELSRIRVLCVDDHPLVQEGIASVINAQPDMLVVAQAFNGCEAIKRFREHKPDVTLMDLRLPDMNGIDAIIAIRAEFPDARVIVLTTYGADIEIQSALTAGARSYLLKSMPPKEMQEAIRQVHAGKKRIPPEIAAQLAEHMGEGTLSGREIEVLRLVMAGNRNRDIANHLLISEETVKAHLKHIMDKLGASDRTQAITIAVRRGMLQL